MRLLPIICCLVLAGCGDDGAHAPSDTGSSVTLILSSDEKIANPTDEQIREALSGLNVGRDGEGFAILERDEMTYMQVSGDQTIGFDMEYQNGDVQKHYRAKRRDFTADEVARALAEYRDGRIDWSDYGQWSRITW